MKVKSIISLFIPKYLISLKSELKEERYWQKRGREIQSKIIQYYSSDKKVNITDEELEVLDYLKKNKIRLLPYYFQDNYKEKDIQVYTDTETGFKYTEFENKRLYFKKNWTDKKIKNYYNYLLVEQDIRSPHRYLMEDFQVNVNDVVVDAGVAEGIFALSVIDNAKKIYLFEPDDEWVEALKLTFKNYLHKVEIVHKFLGNKTDADFTTIDSFLGDQSQIDFMKIDVEGYESDVIWGAINTFRNTNVDMKVAVCTYHKHNDEVVIKELLEKENFSCSYSRGYIPFFYDAKIEEPYLRRCLIRAVKTVKS